MTDKLDLILEEIRAIHARLDEIKPVQGTRWKRQEMPEEWAAIALQLRPDVDYTEAYAAFQGYWEEATGKKAIKANWLTTWKNWIKRQKAVETTKATWRNNDVVLMREVEKRGIETYGKTFDDLRRKLEQTIRETNHH